MRRKNSLPSNTVAEVQAGLVLVAQNGDMHLFTDLGLKGRIGVFYTSDTTTPDDGENVIEETGKTGRWHILGSSLFASGVSVPNPEMIDTAETDIDVSVAGVKVGDAFKISDTQNGTTPIVECDFYVATVPSAGTLRFRFNNNSGATLPAGNIEVNIFKL